MQTRVYSVAAIDPAHHHQQRRDQNARNQQQEQSQQSQPVTAEPIAVYSSSRNSQAKAINMYDAVAGIEQKSEAAKVAFRFSV